MIIMLRNEERLTVSPYAQLYDILVPEDHILRKINTLVDFSFIYDEIKKNYTVDFGRKAADPVYMLKLLLLKILNPLSDRDLCERARYDISFKYFLGIAPEDPIVDDSLLSKFRRQRLKDTNILDLLIKKTLDIAIENHIPLGNTIIVDATHTLSRFQWLSPIETLRKQSSLLRKACYRVNESIKDTFPSKNTSNDIQDELDYTVALIQSIMKNESLQLIPDVKEKINLAQEMIDDYEEHMNIATSSDPDAKIGHKSADTSFHGYKNHLAMTENGLVTGLVVTSGEKADGKYLCDLIEQSRTNGVEVKAIIGDTAYSGKDNLEKCSKENILLYARLNSTISKGFRKKEDEFYFNKDAGMYVCPEGHMAYKKARSLQKNSIKNEKLIFFFDVEKCKCCPLEGICHKIGTKSKTYTLTIKSNLHQEQLDFENSDAFREKSRMRYRIEQKNSELKNRYGLKKSMSNGLFGMTIQSASTVFIANMRKIIREIEKKGA